MEFRKGFKIKPRQVNSDGTVVFTDGTNWYVSGMCTDAAAADVLFHTADSA